MSYQAWINYIQTAEKSSFISGKIRKVHYKLSDGEEMVEEYSMETGVLMRRAWKRRQDVLCMKPADDDVNTIMFNWDIELGEMVPAHRSNDFLLKESNTAPILTKRLTKNNIEWRIRNLPYPIETYSVTADSTKKALIVRTTNKKYFKEIAIPELSRCGLLPEQQALSVAHQHNTLIISYRKPELVTQMERDTLRILQDVETETDDDIELMKQLFGSTAKASSGSDL